MDIVTAIGLIASMITIGGFLVWIFGHLRNDGGGKEGSIHEPTQTYKESSANRKPPRYAEATGSRERVTATGDAIVGRLPTLLRAVALLIGLAAVIGLLVFGYSVIGPTFSRWGLQLSPGKTPTIDSATQTALSSVYPYHAIAPGPSCDPRALSLWGGDVILGGDGGASCSADHTHLEATKSSSCSPCEEGYTLNWDNPPGNAPDGSLRNFKVSVQVANITAKATAYLVFGNPDTVEYWFEVDGDGSYAAVRLQSQYPSDSSNVGATPIASGHLSTPESHKVSFVVESANVTALLDEVSVGSFQDASAVSADYLGLWVGNFNHPGDDSPSADFSNFAVSLLP